MKSSDHVFHTKHDFTPDIAWAAFQILAQFPAEGVSVRELGEISRAIASPLARRSELGKPLAPFFSLGLLQHNGESVMLSECGLALARGLGRLEQGFYSAIHCLYAWNWIWARDPTRASPSWSYRQVCGQILASGSIGITSDELVMQVVLFARQQFDTESISFSRSSVSGVTTWLQIQRPPLIRREGNRFYNRNVLAESDEILRVSIACLCSLSSGDVKLTPKNIRLLAEVLLCSDEEAYFRIQKFASDSTEFILTEGAVPKIIFRHSRDPFITWIVGR